MKIMTSFLVFGIFLLAPHICLSQTILKGIVVEFRTGIKLENVTVTVKDVSNKNIFKEVVTDNKGNYTAKFNSNPEKFNITYVPENLKKYDPAGRKYLIRVTNEMELDTIGLTNKQSGKKDTGEMEQNARNIHGYIMAGGSIDTAKVVFSDARRRFTPYFYDPVAVKFRIAETLEKKTPFERKTPYGKQPWKR